MFISNPLPKSVLPAFVKSYILVINFSPLSSRISKSSTNFLIKSLESSDTLFAFLNFTLGILNVPTSPPSPGSFI